MGVGGGGNNCLHKAVHPRWTRLTVPAMIGIKLTKYTVGNLAIAIQYIGRFIEFRQFNQIQVLSGHYHINKMYFYQSNLDGSEKGHQSFAN